MIWKGTKSDSEEGSGDERGKSSQGSGQLDNWLFTGLPARNGLADNPQMIVGWPFEHGCQTTKRATKRTKTETGTRSKTTTTKAGRTEMYLKKSDSTKNPKTWCKGLR